MSIQRIASQFYPHENLYCLDKPSPAILELRPYSLIERVRVYMDLKSWCNEKKEDPEHNDRLDAAKKIKDCYDSKNRYCNLSGCKSLTTLPKGIRGLTSLEILNLDLEFWCSEKKGDPERFARLDVAKKIKDCYTSGGVSLDLPFNTSLPEAIGLFTNLEMLRLSRCHYITTLPEAIGRLTNLTTLRLSQCTNLTSLPEAIGRLILLKKLDLSECTRLTSIPDAIGLLINLQTLNLSHCHYITTLPEAIGLLTNLETLNLPGTNLTSLPEAIGRLILLKKLDLSLCTGLTRLPHGLARLPRHCVIITTYAGLDARSSVEFQDAITRVIAANPNLGPTWFNTVRERPLPVTIGFKDAVSQYITLITDIFPSEDVSFITQENFINRITNDEQDLLNTFLNRIKETKDFTTTRTQGGVLFTILQIFKTYSEVPEFKETLFCFIHEALASCGDRISITLNRIAIELRLLSPTLTSNLKDFAHFLITYRRLQLVHEEAARIVKEKRLGDAIEPMLYLQIKLKDSLNLPIATEGMLYPGMAYITKNELEKIGSEILAQSDSSEQRMHALCFPLETTYDEKGRPTELKNPSVTLSVTNPYQLAINEAWQKALQAKHPEEFQRVEPPINDEDLENYLTEDELNLYNMAANEEKKEEAIQQIQVEKTRALIKTLTGRYIK